MKTIKRVWDSFLKDILFLYCGLYTIATIVNSVVYLSKGILNDPAGNWHELDRAVIALIIVAAYGLIRYLKTNNLIIKAIIVYVPTLALTLLYVFLRGFTEEPASTAYRDIFFSFTAGFLLVTLIVFLIQKLSKKH